MLKRMMCRHEYKHFYTERYYPLISDHLYSKYKLRFKCSKCGKEYSVVEDDIEYLTKKITLELKRKEFMGVDLSEYEGFSITIDHKHSCRISCYEGYLAYKLLGYILRREPDVKKHEFR